MPLFRLLEYQIHSFIHLEHLILSESSEIHINLALCSCHRETIVIAIAFKAACQSQLPVNLSWIKITLIIYLLFCAVGLPFCQPACLPFCLPTRVPRKTMVFTKVTIPVKFLILNWVPKTARAIKKIPDFFLWIFLANIGVAPFLTGKAENFR